MGLRPCASLAIEDDSPPADVQLHSSVQQTSLDGEKSSEKLQPAISLSLQPDDHPSSIEYLISKKLQRAEQVSWTSKPSQRNTTTPPAKTSRLLAVLGLTEEPPVVNVEINSWLLSPIIPVPVQLKPYLPSRAAAQPPRTDYNKPIASAAAAIGSCQSLPSTVEVPPSAGIERVSKAQELYWDEPTSTVKRPTK